MSAKSITSVLPVSRLTAVAIILALLIGGVMLISRVINPKKATPETPASLNLTALKEGYTATVHFGDSNESSQSGTLIAGKNGVVLTKAVNREILHVDNDTYVKVAGNDSWFKVTLPPTDAVYDAAYFDPDAPIFNTYQVKEEQSCASGTCVVFQSPETTGEFVMTKDNQPVTYREIVDDSLITVTFGPKESDPEVPVATLFKLPEKPTTDELKLLEAMYAKFPEEK